MIFDFLLGAKILFFGFEKCLSEKCCLMFRYQKVKNFLFQYFSIFFSYQKVVVSNCSV